MVGGQTTEPGHRPSTDERDSPAQPRCSSSPLKCTSHLGFSLGLSWREGTVIIEILDPGNGWALLKSYTVTVNAGP